MTEMQEDITSVISRETLAGRLPVPGFSRIYTNFSTLLWTAVALGAASFNYLFGASLAYIGNTKIAIAGYLIGLIVGLVPTYLASGMISYRHGVDPVDAAKSTFGTRGALLMLAMILITTLGWAFVLIAMTGQAAGRLYQVECSHSANLDNNVVSLVSISMLIWIWIFLRRGPAAITTLTRITSPSILIIACVILYLISKDSGIWALINTNISPHAAYTNDPLLQLAYGVEFGVSNAFTSVPFFGGIARLIQKRKHVITPCLLGAGLVGAGFITSVGALAAIATGSTEPAEWIVRAAGNGFGSIIVVVLLIANLGTLVSFFYLAGVSIQQIRALSRLRWDMIVMLLLIPGIPVAFNTSWLLNHVMNWLGYNGAMLMSMAAVMFADYFFLRRQKVIPEHLFVKTRDSAYWFWGGVNWVAVSVVALGVVIYLSLFDPLTMVANRSFRYIAAGLPSFVACTLIYSGLMLLVRNFSSQGSYQKLSAIEGKPIRVGL
ncbi:cytosine permease [Nguyenibacter sp. L1]|uniref:cytosine permease n=1 Tax=Nguyenibacter sp. L1 TaxID=3049350 RepID=UPI002B45DEF3|nr:cytosine permease [Nguyenibacter sp. L1]WRH89801.1 cytosine permease [Nguyenibacter sp. L1]